MKEYSYYDETYGELIVLLIGQAEAAEKFVNKKYGITLDVSGDPGGRTFEYDFMHIVWLPIFKFDYIYTAILVHELTHVALDVFNKVKVEQLNANYSEPFCYYLQCLTRVFLKKIKGKKDK